MSANFDQWQTEMDRVLWQGYLRGFDQMTNLVLTECHERVFSTEVNCALFAKTLKKMTVSQSGVEQVALGTYLVRGDNV